ncbi:protein HASTY 1 isoform X2 [Lolium perenne]|uniref:protein HASTY 1 isoform X2 n=1 Tax=Lolium perenne TaxID=4522 RepID=UPI0021F68FA0|nr:uncharacterized protein LOC127291997 isoform X2 [Lolium perenne]
MATSSPMVTSSPIEDQYNVTAMGWASSPSPAELAEAIGGIHKFATARAPEVVLERCEQLLNNSNPTLQECGFNLLLFLVRKRWSDLSDEQKQSVFSAVPKLIAFAGMASAWSIKNTMAIIVSQLIGQDVAGNWAKLVDALSCDEIMAERTIITCISEGITIPNDESKDKRLKDLKIENWDSLSEAMFSLILKHLGKYNPSQVAEFQPHYDLVLFAANTVSAYAQWGEVKNLVKGVGGMDLIIRRVQVTGSSSGGEGSPSRSSHGRIWRGGDGLPVKFAWVDGGLFSDRSTSCGSRALDGGG